MCAYFLILSSLSCAFTHITYISYFSSRHQWLFHFNKSSHVHSFYFYRNWRLFKNRVWLLWYLFGTNTCSKLFAIFRVWFMLLFDTSWLQCLPNSERKKNYHFLFIFSLIKKVIWGCIAGKTLLSTSKHHVCF